MLPKIIIKKILKYLLNDLNNLKNYLFISKDLRKYLLSFLTTIQSTNKNQIYSILSNKEKLINNENYLKDNIKKIVIKNNDFKYSNGFNQFSNLKHFKIDFTRSEDRINLIDFYNRSNRNKKLNLKYKSYGFYFKFDEKLSNIYDLKKIKMVNGTINIEEFNKILENSKSTLKSLDLGFNNFLIYLCKYTMWELDLDEEIERNDELEKRNQFKENLLQCKNLKKLSLRSFNRYAKNSYKYFNECRYDIADAILYDTIDQYIEISSKLNKVHLYGIQIKSNEFFNALKKTKSNIKSLKLVSIPNFHSNQFDIFDQFIEYLKTNNGLKKLTIKQNRFGDTKKQFSNYLLNNQSLLKLNISFTDLVYRDIFKSINNNQYQNLLQLRICDNYTLPFDYLLDSQLANKLIIRYDRHYKESEILTEELIKKLKDDIYSMDSGFSDVEI